MQQPRPAPEAPLNFTPFWSVLGKLVYSLMRQHAHGEIVITLHDGTIPFVRVNRTFKPQNLPDV